MVTTVHLLAGALIGIAIKQPLVVVLVAFSTHYLLDAIPHYAPKPVKNFQEEGLKGASIIEIAIKGFEPLIGVGIIVYLSRIAPNDLVAPLIIGAVFGWLPDFFVFLEWKYGINRPWPFRDFEIKTHKHIGGLKGVTPQLIVCLGCLLLCVLRLR